VKNGSLGRDGTNDFIAGVAEAADEELTRRTVVFARARDGAFFVTGFFVVFFAVAIVLISSLLILEAYYHALRVFMQYAYGTMRSLWQ
jgi:hypothetical protein